MHVPGAIWQAHGFAKVIEELHKPHPLLGGVDARDIAVPARTDVRVLVDNEVGAGLLGELDLCRRLWVGSLGLVDLEELHASNLVHGQHGGRQAGGCAQEMPTGQLGLGGVVINMRTDLLAQMSAKKEGCPLLLWSHW